MLNGQAAKTAVYIAGALTISLFLSYTAIIMSGHQIPLEFQGYGNILLGALVGFIAGSRVVTPDVSAEIKQQPLSDIERKEWAKHENAQSLS